MDSIPTQLTSLPQWLTWRYEDDTKKPNCRWKDPESWVSYAEIQGFEKIGFVFTDKDDLCGVDLDGCINAGGFYEPWSIEILQKFRGVAYAEVSPSGTGVKLWTLAKKPSWAKCQHKFPTENRQQIECYDQGRWFAVTGQAIEGYAEIGDGQEALDWLCDKYLKTEPKKVAVPTLRFSSSRLIDRVREYVANAERPAEGGRNNAAFRLAGHLFAFVQPDGERLSESEVLEWVLNWNSTLPVPMDESEIESVVKSAARNGTPREDKEASVLVDTLGVDLSGIINQAWSTVAQEQADEENDSDEDFCGAMVPESGLLRQVFDFYGDVAYQKSSVMGMAVAVSLCQTIFGRRIRSHTDMRTNDYNLVLAPTGSGKEACETAITKILLSADVTGSHQIPPDVQSGNGLIKAISTNPCGIWVCDEFGKILQAVLDKKGNHFIKAIGNHLLKLYGKSSGYYGGSAYANEVKNRIVQPHLVVLGLATGCTVFSAVGNEQVSDGLLSRIAFWPVQDRPEPKEDMEIAEPSAELVQRVREWIEFAPSGNLGSQFPNPEVVRMSSDANARWKAHEKEIRARMHSESESRAAVWSRAGARSMKLALVHRAARLEEPPKACQWEFIQIELHDVNWGIKLSNWLARTSCDLVRENTVDTSLAKAKAILIAATQHGPVSARDLMRSHRSITGGDFKAAADLLGYTTTRTKTKGRPKVFFERPTK